MKASLALLFWFWTITSIAVAAPEVMPGCEGEGCDCFQVYRSATPRVDAKQNDIPAIRPFTLYKDRSGGSQLLGRFEAGTQARPLKQELMVDVKGEYIVESVRDEKLPLKKGDRIDTIINDGEGFARGRVNGKWVEFDFENVQLKTVRHTVLSSWMLVRANGIEGFTREQPFQMCLE